jgi:hypothetical protein
MNKAQLIHISGHNDLITFNLNKSNEKKKCSQTSLKNRFLYPTVTLLLQLNTRLVKLKGKKLDNSKLHNFKLVISASSILD